MTSRFYPRSLALLASTLAGLAVHVWSSPVVAAAAVPARSIAVNLVVSKTHGLVNFVETISGDWKRSATLKTVFDESPANNAQAQAMLGDFRALAPTLHSGSEYPGYPAGRITGLNLSTVLLALSVHSASDDLEAFSRAASAVMPPDAHRRYMTVLRYFAPVYEQLVWLPTAKKMAAYRDRLAAKVRQWGMAEILGKAAAFYGARWTEGLPFTVALYPMPGKSGRSKAESLGGLESVGVFVDESDEDIAERFGVIVHEICHSFYEAQGPELQFAWERAFVEAAAAKDAPASAAYAPLAYELINEGLATALGNGWAASRASKLPVRDTDNWYADERTNAFAHAIYPLVLEYLTNAKPIDDAFAQAASAIFAEKFPDAPRETATLLREATVITENKTHKPAVVGQALRAAFRIPSMHRLSPATGMDTSERAEAARGAVVIAATASELGGLLPLETAVPGIGDAITRLKAAPSGSIYAKIDRRGRAVILLTAEDPAAVSAAIARLAAIKVIPEAGVVLP